MPEKGGLWVRGESLPHWRSSSTLRSCLRVRGECSQRPTDWGSVGSDIDTILVLCGEKGVEPEGKALNLLINLFYKLHL